MEFPPGWDESWKVVGSTPDTTFYVDHERIMLVLPDPQSHDTGATARQHLDFLRNWFATHDDPPLMMIFFDRIVSQDRAARKTYSEGSSTPWARGIALVGGTLLGRALGSFFLGLARTAIPLKFFPDIAEARVWLRSLPQDVKPP